MTNAFAVLRLLPMSNRDKDLEILALRHQITVLERQLGKGKVRFDAGDRAFLAALLHRLPLEVLRSVRLLVRPDKVLRWHRDLLARRHPGSTQRLNGRPVPGPRSCAPRPTLCWHATSWRRSPLPGRGCTCSRVMRVTSCQVSAFRGVLEA
ncbi:hypothetical protein AB0J72_32975 [Dactylosporangium sp. NPDC049742]|uniref:hypothetical protein n=1 Tax=Dactylosporangium sp. NPDC049742 TaxID=3154737 RepID=UPI0034482390